MFPSEHCCNHLGPSPGQWSPSSPYEALKSVHARPLPAQAGFRFGANNGPRCLPSEVQRWVESRCGAVAVGCTYLLPPLSIGGALVVQPWLRFHIPLIEPDKQISRIRLSDKTSRFAFACNAICSF